MTVLGVRHQYNAAEKFTLPFHTRRPRPLRMSLWAATCLPSLALLASPVLGAEPWQPFPPSVSIDDFGGVGLLQTPTARFADDGQITFGANHVQPYDRYFFTVQGTPWLEATLRLTTVRNRLYSPFPEFSGTQSYKDRGFDVKIRVAPEGVWTPAIALGLRDFIGTGLFSSEYLVFNKNVGAFDLSAGVGWGNLSSRGLLPNPFRLISSRFDNRGTSTAGGGSVNASYFKGRDVALFGGVKYETPLKGLSLKAEYDANDYKSEALGNRFRVRLPVNLGFDYAVRSWLHIGGAVERGNTIGLNLALTTNFNRPFRVPKLDDTNPAFPPHPVPASTPAVNKENAPAINATATSALQPIITWTSASIRASSALPDPDLKKSLVDALSEQGAGLYAADFRASEVVLYVGQGRFFNMATGLGRVSRAAFSILPERYQAVTVVFVEGGMETISVRVYRDALRDALTPGRGSPPELLQHTDFALPPLALDGANYQGPLNSGPPRFVYSLRPAVKTTLGRPEQFLLYQAGVRLNGFLQIARGLNVQGAVSLALADNFNKLRIPSNSNLPHVRSDIKDYLKQGERSIPILHANYAFNITPSLYGHVYGGLLEEMYGGVGGEVLFRRSTENWALGADLTYVKQRGFNQLFDFRRYNTLTGFVTGAYYFTGANIDVRLRVGRYLARDYGGTFEIARTFDSGVVIGAFATKTNVSASQFGEGSFDKGIYLSIPLDAVYSRHVRGTVGLTYRPLIRDGGQMVVLPQQLLNTTDDTIRAKFRRDWDGVGR